MKLFVALPFGLLLIVAQTFAGRATVGGSAAGSKPGCCGDECYCCVGQSGTAVPAPLESTAPATGLQAFLLPLAPALAFSPLPSVVQGHVGASETLRGQVAPIFLKNCVLLI